MAKSVEKKVEVLVLNQIAQVGLKRLPAERYSIVKEAKAPEVVLVRSQDLHGMDFGPNIKAVGRAGAGVNNIPVAALSKSGIPVFNAPGANANAVKELVLAGMLMAARNLVPALEFVRGLNAAAPDLDKQVEKGKASFAGVERALGGGARHVARRGAEGEPLRHAARAAVGQDAPPDQHEDRGADAPGGDTAQFLARGRGRRRSRAEGPAQPPAEVPRDGFPVRRAGQPAGRRRAAAPRRLDARGGRQLRRDGGGPGARVPGGRHAGERGEFSGCGHRARVALPARGRPWQCA